LDNTIGTQWQRTELTFLGGTPKDTNSSSVIISDIFTDGLLYLQITTKS
jgi:hypothetical protein